MEEMFSDSLSYASSDEKTVRDEEQKTEENRLDELLKSDENMNSSSFEENKDLNDNKVDSKDINSFDFDSGDSQSMRFSEKYQAIRILGSGSFGMVIEAVDLKSGTSQAVKVIQKNSVSPGQIDFLRREADILSSLQHENIVQFEKVIESETRIFIVMELLNCGSLHSLCKDKHINNEWFSEEETATIMHSIFSAVAYFHSKGVIHRDIKPENILIGDKNDLRTVKIADFGLSTVFETVSSISVSQRCGTLLYMAPEFFARKTYSKPIDIWSCAVIMFKLLSGGHHPFFDPKLDDIKSIKAKIHKTLLIKFPLHFPEAPKNLLKKMMALDPSLRYTANQVLTHPWISKKIGGEAPLTMEETLNIINAQQGFKQKIYAIFFINYLRQQKQSQVQQSKSPPSSSSSLSLSEQYKEKLKAFSKMNAREKKANKKIDVVSSHYFHSVMQLDTVNTSPQLEPQQTQVLESETIQNLDLETPQNLDSSSTQNFSQTSDNHSPQSNSFSSQHVQQHPRQNSYIPEQSPLLNPKQFLKKELSPSIYSKKPGQYVPLSQADNSNHNKVFSHARHNTALPKITSINTQENNNLYQQPQIISPERFSLQTENIRNTAHSTHNYHVQVMNREQLNDCIRQKERKQPFPSQQISPNSPLKKPFLNGGIPNNPDNRDQTKRFHELLHQGSQESSPITNKRIITAIKKPQINGKQNSFYQEQEEFDNSIDSPKSIKTLQAASPLLTSTPLRIKILVSGKRVVSSQDTAQCSWNHSNIQTSQYQHQQSTSSEDSSKSPVMSPSLPRATKMSNYNNNNNTKLIHLQPTEAFQGYSYENEKTIGSFSIKNSQDQGKNDINKLNKTVIDCQEDGSNCNNVSQLILNQSFSREVQNNVQKNIGLSGAIGQSIQTYKYHKSRAISQDGKISSNENNNNDNKRNQNLNNSKNNNHLNQNHFPPIISQKEPSTILPSRQHTYSTYNNTNNKINELNTKQSSKIEQNEDTRILGPHLHCGRMIIRPKSILVKKNNI